MHDLPNFRMEDYPLAAVAVGLWEGHMFLNLGESPRPLAEQLGALPDKFRAWGMEQLRMGKRIVYDVASNWKLIIQNYSECLHCPGVHPALQTPLAFPERPERAGQLRVSRRPDGSAGRHCETCPWTASLRLPACPACADDHRRVYYLRRPAEPPAQPASRLHDDPHPLAPRRGPTEIVCEWHFHPEAMASPGFRLDEAVSFWDMTNRQDWHVCEQMQLGLKSRALPPRSLLPSGGSAARLRPVDPVRGRMTGQCRRSTIPRISRSSWYLPSSTYLPFGDHLL